MTNNQISQKEQQTPLQCSRYLHDYIKCIYHDEVCCADLYQKYKECSNKQLSIDKNNGTVYKFWQTTMKIFGNND